MGEGEMLQEQICLEPQPALLPQRASTWKEQMEKGEWQDYIPPVCPAGMSLAPGTMPRDFVEKSTLRVRVLVSDWHELASHIPTQTGVLPQQVRVALGELLVPSALTFFIRTCDW